MACEKTTNSLLLVLNRSSKVPETPSHSTPSAHPTKLGPIICIAKTQQLMLPVQNGFEASSVLLCVFDHSMKLLVQAHVRISFSILAPSVMTSHALFIVSTAIPEKL